MATLTAWTRGGKLLVDSRGRVILCDRCPCSSGSYVVHGNCCFGFPITLSRHYNVYYFFESQQSLGVTLQFTGSGYNGWWEGSAVRANGDQVFARLSYRDSFTGPEISFCRVQLFVTVTRGGTVVYSDGADCTGNAGGNPSNSCDFTDPTVFFGEPLLFGHPYATTRSRPFAPLDPAFGVCP